MSEDPNTANIVRLEEELVAYLDGELDADAARRVEELLAADSKVRRRLQQLSRTWDALDQLAPATVDEDFTRTTLEMVAVAAQEDVEQERDEAPRRRRRKTWVAAGGLLAAGLAGFLSVAFFWPDPNEQLLRDLPVLENLDRYHQVQDMSFLEMLSREGLFAEGPVEEKPKEQGRARVEKMTSQEKAELARREQRFTVLEPGQREELYELHRQLDEAPEGPQLRDVMDRYYAWVKTLPPYTRAELLEQSPAERIKQVQKIREHELRKKARRLSPQEVEGIRKWVEAYLGRRIKHSPELVESLHDTSFPHRRMAHMKQLFSDFRAAASGKPSPISQEDLADLRSRLSPEHQKQLEGEPFAEQCRIIASWIRGAFQQRVLSSRMGMKKEKTGNKELTQFFEEKLDAREQDHLLGLPGEQMRVELERMYWEHKNPGSRARLPKRGFRSPPPDFRERPTRPPHRPDDPFGRHRGPRRSPESRPGGDKAKPDGTP